MSKFDPNERHNIYKDKPGPEELGRKLAAGNYKEGVKAESNANYAHQKERIPTTQIAELFDLQTTAFDILKNEQGKGNDWNMVLVVKSDATLTFTIKVNCKTGLGSVRVDSNKEPTWTYRGKFLPVK